VQFAHPIVRESIYGAIAVSERAVMHAKAAALLAADGGVPARAAAHLLRGEPAGDSAAVQILLDAARDAMSRGAAEIGVSYLRRARSEPPDASRRTEVLLELGRAEARTGNAADGFELIGQALELTTDSIERAEIALELGRGLVVLDRAGEAIRVFDLARAAVGTSAPELADRLEAERAGVGLVDVSMATAALERLRRICMPVERDSLGQRLLLAYSSFALAADRGAADQAAARAERALADGKLMHEGTLVALCFAAFTLAFCDRFDPALEAFEGALDVARRRGSRLMYVLCSWGCSHVHYRRGSLANAAAHARSAIDAGLEPWFTASVGVLADALIERGALPEAADAYTAHSMEGELWPDLLVSNFLLASRGRLHCATGDTQAGLEDLLRCGRRLTCAGIVNPALIPWRSDAALAHLALDQLGEARRLAAAELELARRFGARRAIGIASRAAGLVEARAGNEPRALELFGCATRELERSGAQLEYARSLVEDGAALRRSSRRVRARELLRHGMDLASDCGASALAARAHDELIAAGARPRRERIRGADSLTASERRVALLAADGKTNREIAEALFITMNTVGKHLTHIYSKLDIADRALLTPALAKSDATSDSLRTDAAYRTATNDAPRSIASR
jgi:DNA-binding CsgD family transcriptional regulator